MSRYVKICLFSAAEIIPPDKQPDFEAALRCSRTRELVRSRTSATKSGEIKQLKKSVDLPDSSVFLDEITGGSSLFDNSEAHTMTPGPAAQSFESMSRSFPNHSTPTRTANNACFIQNEEMRENGHQCGDNEVVPSATASERLPESEMQQVPPRVAHVAHQCDALNGSFDSTGSVLAGAMKCLSEPYQ